ncbi:hypothetical protein [Reyranella sp.]|uniref:hypothetical protein n=1 Tax=Reyranella sp. TaxID=1929291 RepID=UPI0025D543B0|nr:hypothetical protein [Reyranella sp.]
MSAPRRIALIIAADEPALFYDSVASAELDLEAIDVRDGVYGPVYGRNGEAYRIDAVGGRVVIVPDRSKTSDPDGLRQVLTAFLRQAMPNAKVDSDLATLLLHCEPYLERISVGTKTW